MFLFTLIGVNRARKRPQAEEGMTRGQVPVTFYVLHCNSAAKIHNYFSSAK